MTDTMRTADGVQIIDGLRVLNNDMEIGTVVINDMYRPYREREWWFYMLADGNDRPSLVSESRVARRDFRTGHPVPPLPDRSTVATDDELNDLDDLEFDRPGLSLSLEQQSALATAVEARFRSCDGTLRAAQEWAHSAGIDWPPLRRELEENGGYCDCEVVLNVMTSCGRRSGS